MRGQTGTELDILGGNMIALSIQRRPEDAKLGWSEVREAIVGAFFLVFSVTFLSLSV